MKLRLKLNSDFRLPVFPSGDRRRLILRALTLRIDKKEGVSTWIVELFWKRIAAGLAVAGVVFYFVAASLIWVWLARVPQNQVRWLSVVTLPVRPDVFRAERGETSITIGFAQLEAKDYGEAFFNLQAGLARSPGNARARVTVAAMVAGGNPAQALSMLETGLKHSPDSTELLRALFAAYQQQQATTRAFEKARELFERQPPLAPAARQLVAGIRAAQLIERGEFEAANQLLASLPPSTIARDDARFASLRADALARLGRGDEATALLEKLPEGAPPADLARVQAEVAIATSDATALDRALRRLRATDPNNPQSYFYGFQAWHRMKRLTLRDLAEQDFYRAFGASDAALQAFAALAVNLDLPEVVQRALDTGAQNRLSPFAFRVHLTEIALRRGDFDSAFRQLRLWEKEVETLSPMQRAYPQFIERLTRVTIAGGEPQIAALESHLSELRGRVTAPMYALAVRVLEQAGRPEAALSVARIGIQFYPHSDSLQAATTRIGEALRVTAQQKESSVASKSGPVVSVPNTADATLKQLDQHFAAEELTAARNLLRAIREVPPAWAAGIERELTIREVQLAVLTLDAAAARSAVRTQLAKLRTEDDALRLVQLARSLIAQQRVREARLLHDELAAERGSSANIAAALRGLNLPDELAVVAAKQETALAAIDRALERGQPAEALRIVEHVRKQAPAWLEAARSELGVREVRMRLALDQRPLAMAALKELVVRSGVPRSAAFKLVRDFAIGGDRETAQLLAREVVRLLPGDAAAARLLKEVESTGSN